MEIFSYLSAIVHSHAVGTMLHQLRLDRLLGQDYPAPQPLPRRRAGLAQA